eukprot:4199281-Prymnesium_polylepis.1
MPSGCERAGITTSLKTSARSGLAPMRTSVLHACIEERTLIRRWCHGIRTAAFIDVCLQAAVRAT